MCAPWLFGEGEASMPRHAIPSRRILAKASLRRDGRRTPRAPGKMLTVCASAGQCVIVAPVVAAPSIVPLLDGCSTLCSLFLAVFG